MKLQFLCVAAVALIQSAFVASHEVPSFRGVSLLDDAKDATAAAPVKPAETDAPEKKDELADETEEEEQWRRRGGRGRSWRGRGGRGRRSWRGRRRGGGFRRRRGGGFGRCMRNCGGGRRRCARRCNFTEEDILDLFEFTGGFSVMPDDEDFEENFDYGQDSADEDYDSFDEEY